MESSDDSHHEDIWSPSLREAVFSTDDIGLPWSSEPRLRFNHSPLPRHFLSQPIQPLNNNHPPAQQPPGNNTQPASSSSSLHIISAPLNRKRSHLDPPNFPLQSDPVGNNSNSSGRPLASTNFHSRPTTPSTRELPRPVTPTPEDLFFSSSSSDRSGTPWPDTEDLSDFVDLTADSSPPPMPSTKNPANRSLNPAASRPSRDSSAAPSNPAKRRKTVASQSSSRSQRIEEIDLRDIDDDNGLSRVLEQQRLATIKAQQEQASKPLKLSTLQCIICMESMKDLTATHCGHLFCHSCLMEALIAGENQGSEPGKGTPKCPVCRKKVLRPTERRDYHNVVPLSMKVKTKIVVGKGKGRAS